MIVCAQCGHYTSLADEHWLAVRPLADSAFIDTLTLCSPRCAVLHLEHTYQPPKGLAL